MAYLYWVKERKSLAYLTRPVVSLLSLKVAWSWKCFISLTQDFRECELGPPSTWTDTLKKDIKKDQLAIGANLLTHKDYPEVNT